MSSGVGGALEGAGEAEGGAAAGLEGEGVGACRREKEARPQKKESEWPLLQLLLLPLCGR